MNRIAGVKDIVLNPESLVIYFGAFCLTPENTASRKVDLSLFRGDGSPSMPSVGRSQTMRLLTKKISGFSRSLRSPCLETEGRAPLWDLSI